MDASSNPTQMQSSPTSFHTVQEFKTPSSFPSLSDFEGFSDDDNWPVQSPTLSSHATPPSSASASLAPPPTHDLDGSLKTFASMEDALAFWQSWAADHDYAVRKHRSKSRSKEQIIYKVYVECECAGKKRGTKIPEQYRIRKDQASKACGCPFRGSITEKDGLWSIQITCSDHSNHLPLLRPADSAIHRRAAREAHPELAQQVANHLQTRIQPKKTMDDWLLKNPAAPVVLRDVYNLFASTKRQRDGGLSPIQALFANLTKENSKFLYDSTTDESNALWNLVFFDTTSLDFLRRFPSTIVLDSTYKTNKFNLYLLDIVGVTATNNSFIIGQAFLSAESTEDYIWVLEWVRNYYREAQLPNPRSITTDKAGGLAQAVTQIFPDSPHLLCIWHINNDVEAHCRELWKKEISTTKDHTTAEERSTFVESRWTDLRDLWQATIYATTEDEFEASWALITSKYWDEYPEIISYLADTWLCHKEKFCLAWTNKVTHYGNAVTSRAESIHHAIKKDLPSRLLHLHDVWQLLSLYLTRTANELKHKLGYERSKIKDSHRKAILVPLHHHISHHAIDKVLEHCQQFNLFANSEAELIPCTKAFTTTLGLPCAHLVQEKLRANELLQLDNFHPQWYLDNPAVRPPIDPLLLIRDPVKIRARGKDNGKKGPRELIQVERGRRATAGKTAKAQLLERPVDYTKVPRPFEFVRSMEDLITHLPPELPNGPSFRRAPRHEMTENNGVQELFPDPYWVDELWHEEVRLAPETYRIYQELGLFRNRRIKELLYWREDRADLEAMREAARQAHREKLQQQQAQIEAREEATAQGLRRSWRGRIPIKRKREL